MKLLYVIDLLGLDEQQAESVLDHNECFFKGINSVERGFILKIIHKIKEEKQGIDLLIANNLIGWKVERLLPVDRALLRMGVAESFFNGQKAVIIDDVIRIAKKYGGEDSYKIINAVLDKVIE